MVKQTSILWTVMVGLGILSWVVVVAGTQSLTTINVVIDRNTVNSTLNSPATLPLGTTVILVCSHSGIPHGLQTNYHWTCPNEPCQQTGYAGRKINNNIIAINITSTSDGGTYTCTVTAEGREASQQFQLKVTGGQVVHSYGRLIIKERVITDKQQLQPPNNDSRDGRIECRVSSGEARFNYHGRPRPVPTDTSEDVHQIRRGSTATAVIRDRAFNNFVNFEGKCADIYHYLFLSGGNLPDVSITGTTSTDTRITVNIGTRPSGVERVIIGYHRLDLGVPVVGLHVNNGKTSTQRKFSSLVPGAKYRITAWGLGGGDDKRRSQSPAVSEVTTMEQIPSRPRHLTITRVFDDGIELNWIPPREPNGDIRHYIIKYTTQNGTQQEINTANNINYYNLTGLKRGQTYNITVVAVNSVGGGGGSQPIISYVHNSTVDSTKLPQDLTSSLTARTPKQESLGTPTSSPTTSTPTDFTTVLQDTTDNPTSTSDTDVPIPIIGAAVGGITLLLVSVLVIIICTIAIVRTRRGKRNKTTLHNHPVLYSTLQVGEKDVHEYTLPTGEHQQDYYNTGGQYDEVDVKLQPQPSMPPGYEAIDDYREGKENGEADKNGKATDTTSPDELYAQPDKKKNKKRTEEEIRREDIQNPELLYDEVDKPKKKKGKIKKVKDKDEHEQQQGELLYAEVNKPKKKGKKDKIKLKQDTQQSEEQQEEAVTSQTGLGYEPSADSDSTPQQQNGEENTTQLTPSATVEGLYAEVDKTRKKNKKKDEE